MLVQNWAQDSVRGLGELKALSPVGAASAK
jgi:hypothetical protein